MRVKEMDFVYVYVLDMYMYVDITLVTLEASMRRKIEALHLDFMLRQFHNATSDFRNTASGFHWFHKTKFEVLLPDFQGSS